MPSLDPVAAAPSQENVDESPSALDVPPEIESDTQSNGEDLGVLEEAMDDEQPIDDSLDAPIDDTLDEPVHASSHAPSFLEDVEDAIDDAELIDVDETIESDATIENDEGEPPVELTESDEQDDLDEFEVR
jgi:hypothetical protein